MNELQILIDQLRQSQWWNAGEIADAQNQALPLIVRHHATHTPHFQARLASQGLTADDVADTGILKFLEPFGKKDIQDAGNRFDARYVPADHLPIGNSQSSGSTGQPVTTKKDRVNGLFWAAHTIRDHQWYRRDYSGKLSAIRAQFDHYEENENWGGPVASLYGSGRAQGIPITTDVRQQLAHLERFQPNILIVHAGVLSGFTVEWQRSGYTLNSLRHIRNLGDTVTEELREKVRNLAGLEIEDNYSSSEVGYIAIQCPHSGLYHTMDENLVVEILDEDNNDCRPGEIGRVVVTDLFNTASPIIRYDLGDYAEVGKSCACGRHLTTLKKILGRRRNLLIRSDGTRFWPKAGQKEILKQFNIRQWQIVQHRVDDIEYKFVTDNPFTDDEESRLRRMVNEILGYHGEVRVSQQSHPIPTNRGKFEESICLVQK